MIHAFIKFCLVLNPYQCQLLEIVPADHAMTSIIECMRGVSMGNQAEFTYQGAQWRIRGGMCRETPDGDLAAYLRSH